MALSNTLSRQKGLSLIELMVALLLGVLLLGGIVVIFEQNKRNSVQDEQVARMQEGGRFALQLLSRNLALSGFFGSVPDNRDISVSWTSGTDCLYDHDYDGTANRQLRNPRTPFYVGNDATTSGFSCITDPVNPGSDVLMVNRVFGGSDMTIDVGGTQTGSLVSGAIYVKTGARGEGNLFQASSTTDSGSATVPNPAAFWRFDPQVFFVRNFSVSNGDGIPTLCRNHLTTAAVYATECLVEGVEYVQVEFGIDDSPGDGNNVPNYYVANPDAAELSQIITARIFVLMRSVNPIANYVNDKTYTLGTRAVDFDTSTPAIVDPPNDSFLRRVYSTTVLFRNSSLRKECAWIRSFRPGLTCF